MNKPLLKHPRLSALALALGALGTVPAGQAQLITPAAEPLGTSASSVKPNIMFILDDSGSMAREFMPDYVDDQQPRGSNPTLTSGCYDSGDGGNYSSNTEFDDSEGRIDGVPDACEVGDPPFMSADFNTIYYNPAIQYRPAMNADGTPMASQDATETASWTLVRTDAFNVENYDQRGTSADYVDLSAGYPDRVWCLAYGDAATSVNCRQNTTNYSYPDFQFTFGRNANNSTGRKYISTGPYYWRMQSARYCTDAGGGVPSSTCKSGSDIVIGTHTVRSPELCKDVDLTDCKAAAELTTAQMQADYVFSGVRWCNNTGLLESTISPFTNQCQRKKLGNFKYAKHLGLTQTVNAPFAAVPNEGQINVNSVIPGGGSITQVQIGTTIVFSGSAAVPAGATPSQAAAILAGLIDPHASYNAVPAGAAVVITQATAGTAGSGAAITVTATTGPATRATGSFTVNQASGSSTTRTISTLTVNGVNLLCPLGSEPAPNTQPVADQGFGNNVTVKANSPTNGRIEATQGWTNDNKRNSVRSALIARINACGVGGYSASAGGTGQIILTAPLSQAATPNGHLVTATGTSISGNFSVSNMSGGSTGPAVSTTTFAMGGGQAAITSGSRVLRKGVGVFRRTDIVPGVTYAKTPARTDCSGSVCTYEEEMTNFANWYTYYRSRMKMMKTAAGRAFASVDDTFRVGFITINPTSSGSVTSSKYLRINDFSSGTGGHKEAWYTKFYQQDSANSTPLRQALSRVGWIFAGKLNTGLTSGVPTSHDPVTASCQPNFAILSTDGYWNGSGGQRLDGTNMTNQDNVDSGYSKREDGAYDGNLLSTTDASDSTAGGRNTLADVAMYYYKTDLRTPSDTWAPTGGWGTAITNNNVPTTNKDANGAQHMVTFTLGLGLDGTLTYRSDYETADTGDFHAIKQGTKDWPAPQGDEPSALDDLWHAAVNGRGTFFSARDPQTLSESLLETLAALNTRVGAGAAAATSNLQPVAGDNFAFTAQYQTVDWIGDLKARTIELSSGIVATRVLWSAAELLDAREHTSRKIYTFDATDTTGNLMKHFCWPGNTITNCNDGAGVDLTDFNATTLLQVPGFGGDSRDGNVQGTAGSQRLVDYLRGDHTYEDSGALASTDLFRTRASLLGDIINAQPAYVKKSPFAYSDAGYDGFRKCTEGVGTACPTTLFPDPTKQRLGTVYAASNDGMLHAFETDVANTATSAYYQSKGIASPEITDDEFQGIAPPNGNGEERWAYVPGTLLPTIKRLANIPYAHRYFADGSPAVGDICIASGTCTQDDWRTILVGGFNSGGMGYYALDVTNPAAPKALWEFRHSANCFPVDAQGVPQAITTPATINPPFYSDCHLGLSYGNPLITKLKSTGKWVVIVTSGYNNNVSGGDGKGYVYILEAHTGKILHRLSTGVGTAAAPSGLAKINGWTTNGNVDNTTLAVYGGDLQGNMWRFQLDSDATNYLTVARVAKAVDSLGVAQPITVKPELGQVSDGSTSKRVILFGTGKFLEDSDPDTTQRQTIYALRDDENTNPVAPATAIIPNVRAGSAVRVRQFAPTSPDDDTRTVQAGTAPTWSTEWGWLIDLPDTGERVNVDPQLQLGTLVVASNVPDDEACTAGGFSWLNFLDYRTGGYIQVGTSTVASQKIGASLTVGINVIMLPGGGIKTIATTADNQQLSKDTPITSGTFSGRRVSWRELVRE